MKKVRFKINGEFVTKEEWDAHESPVAGNGIPMTNSAYSDSKPLVSEALGCMTAQVPEMREQIKERGIQGVKVRNDGQLEITSRLGRKQVCAMRGMRDNDGGYSD